MDAYGLEHWHDLFLGTLGAVAALLGLLFVALSVNLERIINTPAATERAQSTLMLLMVALITSCLVLVPQSIHALGIELVFMAVVEVLVLLRLQLGRYGVTEARYKWKMVLSGTIEQSAVVPLLAGAGSLLAQTGGGMYWIAAAIVAALIAASFNAWVILVEIVR